MNGGKIRTTFRRETDANTVHLQFLTQVDRVVVVTAIGQYSLEATLQRYELHGTCTRNLYCHPVPLIAACTWEEHSGH
jgi:hypothetical protein